MEQEQEGHCKDQQGGVHNQVQTDQAERETQVPHVTPASASFSQV
jgi:hypothetical protein